MVIQFEHHEDEELNTNERKSQYLDKKKMKGKKDQKENKER